MEPSSIVLDFPRFAHHTLESGFGKGLRGRFFFRKVFLDFSPVLRQLLCASKRLPSDANNYISNVLQIKETLNPDHPTTRTSSLHEPFI